MSASQTTSIESQFHTFDGLRLRYLGRPHVGGPDVGTSAVLLAAAAHPELMPSATVGVVEQQFRWTR